MIPASPAFGEALIALAGFLPADGAIDVGCDRPLSGERADALFGLRRWLRLHPWRRWRLYRIGEIDRLIERFAESVKSAGAVVNGIAFELGVESNRRMWSLCSFT